LLGKDAFATESHARVFRNAGFMWFIDLALWDIMGKIANLPLYKMWGSSRDKVRAYASTSELGTPENRAELARHYKEAGFNAMKIRFHHDRLADDMALYDSVMKAVPGMGIMVDANQATNLPSPHQGVVWDYRRALATAQELEARGQLRKIAALCETFKLHFFPHHGLSGFGLSGTTHLCCTVPGETWVEMMYEPPTRTVEVYQQLGGIIETPVWIDGEGYVHPPEGPGLGLEVNDALIGKFAI
jgi:L-alanine-DL-glutamate epimerase-like enolase superfamily enzyme